MAIRITCPSCDTKLKIADDKRGRKIRCPQCEEAITVPDDDGAIQDERRVNAAASVPRGTDYDEDDDERPARREKKQRVAKKGFPIWWVIGGGAAVVVVLLVTIVGVATMVLVNRGVDAIEKLGEPKELDLTKGKTVLNQNAVLALTDPRDPAVEDGHVHMKVFPVQLQAGKTYIIAMNSRAFDPYLRLENPKGNTVAEDDDEGGALNSRIRFHAGEGGLYRVIATSFDDNATGPFTLIVQELP